MLEIVDEISRLITGTVSRLTGGDSLATSVAIASVLGAIVYTCRNLPMKILKFLEIRYTVSVTFYNDWRSENREVFEAVGRFVSENAQRKSIKVQTASFSKTGVRLALVNDAVFGIFLCKGRFIKHEFQTAEEQGAIPERMTLTMIGRSVDEVVDFIRKQCGFDDLKVSRKYMDYKSDSWVSMGDMSEPNEIWLDPEIKQKIDAKVDFFLNNKKWYTERGISYKLLIVLEGEPGTGKSRIAHYIADRLNWSLGSITQQSGFVEAIRSAATEGIVVSVPDVDSIGIARRRVSNKNNAASLMDVISESTDEASLSKTLNLFQGDIPLNGSVVVMSTNCIDKIDEALLRPSRCDMVLHVGRMKYPQFNGFYKHHYCTEENLPGWLMDESIRACDVMEAFTDNPFDAKAFEQRLLTITQSHNLAKELSESDT